MKNKFVLIIGLIVVMGIGANIFAPKSQAINENPPAVVHIEGGPVKQTVSVPQVEEIFEQDGILYIIGHPTEEQKRLFLEDMEKRNKTYAEFVLGEIVRKHQRIIEVDKFKNAIMLERSGAPVTVVQTSHHHNVEAIRVQPEVK